VVQHYRRKSGRNDPELVPMNPQAVSRPRSLGRGAATEPQSPELAGGAGFTFEGAVGGYYLAALLGEAYAPGIANRTVCRVAFQQRSFGEPLDDVIVDFRAAAATRLD
jgi:hypothetical protein